MTRANALIVDDEADLLDLVRITLARMDITAHGVTTLAAARAQLASRPFDLCLTDMRLPDGDGTELVRHVTELYPDLPIAMVTAYGNMDTAIAAMKAGAFDFVAKPLDLRVLRELTTAALRLRPTNHVTAAVADLPTSAQLLGDSPQIDALRGLIAKLARNQAPVYINGESGTGKELVARLIHQLGPRAEQPFVPVNCGAIPTELVESELFGHRKGSFTGAVSDKAGLFQAAHGGTLFLDEIADLPLPMQVKLLRAIQEKAVRPVGAEKELPIDVRVISASHRHLEAEVTRGRFRQDLYYRINVIDLTIPPLRERRSDIPILTRYLLARIADANGGAVSTLSEAALTRLGSYDFPGNVRELENILERATALSDGSELLPDDLRLPVTVEAAAATAPVSVTTAPAPPSSPPAAPPPSDTTASLAERLAAIERHILTQTVSECHADLAQAAAALGVTPASLHYRLARLELNAADIL
ncbi:sigma-54-dependent Fis family transcriptional regulator [Rhodoferax sp. 4810]|uniref:Sigma-54-dependent Fis family transcriptional regulator n=1 Tax=Thiospirillum jenense TaxID=1653858 RepID=A0A839HA80_9GAMM|nr:sigma-54 dependent transcriptional regulator [Thiospirillum jenense]MBB1074196.1 sigma-54-dependent Fis family transcriptional regulator [Rhodoferax jenense]MBB1125270.1 sigma-54-dependent Fis family transcriptional regulator [Thiospirillum jenense]